MRARRRLDAQEQERQNELIRKHEAKLAREKALLAYANRHTWDFSYPIHKEIDETRFMFRYRRMLGRTRDFKDTQTKMYRNASLGGCEYSEFEA